MNIADQERIAQMIYDALWMGPCDVETREDNMTIAAYLLEHGVRLEDAGDPDGMA